MHQTDEWSTPHNSQPRGRHQVINELLRRWASKWKRHRLKGVCGWCWPVSAAVVCSTPYTIDCRYASARTRGYDKTWSKTSKTNSDLLTVWPAAVRCCCKMSRKPVNWLNTTDFSWGAAALIAARASNSAFTWVCMWIHNTEACISQASVTAYPACNECIKSTQWSKNLHHHTVYIEQL